MPAIKNRCFGNKPGQTLYAQYHDEEWSTGFWVYILECANGGSYTGYTNNLQKRYQEHCEGKGAKYTRSFKPLS